jgi:hypothetical protein|nr:hypothetical protein [Neorhizobium tomejilense]
MLLDEIKDNFTEEEQAGIRQAMAYLNRNQFFHAETSGFAAVRKALTAGKTRRFIDQAFALLGYQFIWDDIQGWYGILPGEDVAESRTMTLVDTLILLVAAREYNVGFSEGHLDGRGNVQASFNQFCDSVQAAAKPSNVDIDVPRIRASLNRLEFMSVVDLGQKDDASGDLPMKIRPFISRLLPIDVGARIENFIKRRNAEAGGADSIETDDVGLPLEN